MPYVVKHSMIFSAERTKKIAQMANARGKELTGTVNEAVDEYYRAFKREQAEKRKEK